MLNIVLTRESEVPIRAQLALQIEVAIVTGRLAPGKKLPSVRELARRYGVHHNTAAAAYNDLTARGLIEAKRGSGIYVSRRSVPSPPETAREIDDLIASFLELARARGYTTGAIREAVRAWMDRQPPDHVVIVEPAPDIRAILEHEIAGALQCPVRAVGPEALDEPHALDAALVVTSFYHAAAIRERIGPTSPLVTISLNPGDAEMARLQQLQPGALLGIVSVSPLLLSVVSTVISSVRGEDVLVRPVLLSEEEEWKRLARTADAVVCDSLSGEVVAPHTRKRHRVIRLVPETTLEQLRSYFTPDS